MSATLTSLDLLERIIADFSYRYAFKKSDTFFWSSSDSVVFYSPSKEVSENAVWSLLHEIGHAELKHTSYRDDLELLMMEVSAWRKAKELAAKYHLVIEDEHIEECLDSYREWIHARSRCVECKMHAFQSSLTMYECYNCAAKWKVSASPMCVVRKRRLQ